MGGSNSVFSEDSAKEKQDLMNVEKQLEELKKGDNLNIEVERTGNSNADISDNYDDGFEDDEEIQESLPSDSEQFDQPAQKASESGGITISQSLGVDPSVDSLALESYDHIEPVERIR